MRTLCCFGMGVSILGLHTYAAEELYASKIVRPDTFPLVKGAIRQLHGDGTTRPKRVTVFAIEKMLNLPSKQISLCLPQCRAEIRKHEESQEQYWAREVVWAANQLTTAGVPLAWRRIQELTNMRPHNFKACLPYVSDFADKEIAAQLSRI